MEVVEIRRKPKHEQGLKARLLVSLLLTIEHVIVLVVATELIRNLEASVMAPGYRPIDKRPKADPKYTRIA